MYDPGVDIYTALSTISDISIEQGMPDSFFNDDPATLPWSSFKALGWYDILDNQETTSTSLDIGEGVRTYERISRIVVSLQFYSLSGSDASYSESAISWAMRGIGYKRQSSSTIKELIGNTQTAFRCIMRFDCLYDHVTGRFYNT